MGCPCKIVVRETTIVGGEGMHDFKLAIYDSGGKEHILPFDSAQITLAENAAAVQYSIPSRPELAYLPPGTRLFLHMRDTVDGEWKYLIDSYVYGVYVRKTPMVSISVETEVPMGAALNDTVRFAAMFLTSDQSQLPLTYAEFELYGQEQVPDTTGQSMDENGEFGETEFLILLRKALEKSSDSEMLDTIVSDMMSRTLFGEAFNDRHKTSSRFGVLGGKGSWLRKYGLRPQLFKLLASYSGGIPQATLASALALITSSSGYGIYPQIGFTPSGKQFVLQPKLTTAAAPACNTVFPHEILTMDVPVNYKFLTRMLGYTEYIVPTNSMTFPLLRGKLVGSTSSEGTAPHIEVEAQKMGDFVKLTPQEKVMGINAGTVGLTMNEASVKELYSEDKEYSISDDPFLLLNTLRRNLVTGIQGNGGSITTLFNPYALVGLPVTVITGGVTYHGRVSTLQHIIDTVHGTETSRWEVQGMHLFSNNVAASIEPCDGLSGQVNADKIDKLYKDDYEIVTAPGMAKGGENFWTSGSNGNDFLRAELKPEERVKSLQAVGDYVEKLLPQYRAPLAERFKFRKMMTSDDVLKKLVATTSDPVYMEIDDLAAALVDKAAENDTRLLTDGMALSTAEATRRGVAARNLVKDMASREDSITDVMFGDMVPKIYSSSISADAEYPEEELEETTGRTASWVYEE